MKRKGIYFGAKFLDINAQFCHNLCFYEKFLRPCLCIEIYLEQNKFIFNFSRNDLQSFYIYIQARPVKHYPEALQGEWTSEKDLQKKQEKKCREVKASVDQDRKKKKKRTDRVAKTGAGIRSTCGYRGQNQKCIDEKLKRG